MTETPEHGPWVQLRSGAPADLLDLRAEQVVVDDLVVSICRQPRYNAHTVGGVWTVGSHSLLVADLLRASGAPVPIQREGLLHDLPEGIYGDITAPVARAIARLCSDAGLAIDPLVELRKRIDRVVREVVGLPEYEHPLVKRADLIALAIERRDLMAECERDWMLPEFAPTAPANLKTDAYGWNDREIAQAFRARLKELSTS